MIKPPVASAALLQQFPLTPLRQSRPPCRRRAPRIGRRWLLGAAFAGGLSLGALAPLPAMAQNILGGFDLVAANPPPPSLGLESEYYLDLASGNVWGPKSSGQWLGPTPFPSPGGGVSPAAFGAVGNGTVLADGTTTANSQQISSATHLFTKADISKLISIPGALAGVTGNPSGYLNTTIASINPDGTANLTVVPTQTISGTATITFGTDDTAAFQKAVNACAAFGGTIVLGTQTYIISSINWASGVSCFGQGINASILKHIMTTDATGGMIFGNAGGSVTYANCQFQNFQMDMEAATATSGYQVLASCLRMLQPKFNIVTNCWLHGSPATCLTMDFGVDCTVANNIISNYGRLATAANFGGAGFGCALNGNACWIVANNQFIAPTTANSTYGCFFEAESAGVSAEGQAIIIGNTFQGPGTIAAIGDCGLRRVLIANNHIVLPTGSANTGSGIVVQGGTTGFGAGIRGEIIGNVITLMPGDGIKIDFTAGIDAGQYAGYIISNNRIQACAGNGIKLTAAAASAMKNVTIQGNYLDSNHTCGIVTLGAGGFNGLVINDNTVLNNCSLGAGITTAGIAFDVGNIADLTMVGNRCLDNATGTQKYGIGIGAAVAITGAFINDNNLQNNATGGLHTFGGTIAGILNDNAGYNPVGASSGGAGASPWTFTAPTSRGTLYLAASTAITAITKNGVSILVGTVGVNIPYDVPFAANDSIVVTYTGTLSAIQDVA